jgi:hypothetical protein
MRNCVAGGGVAVVFVLAACRAQSVELAPQLPAGDAAGGGTTEADTPPTGACTSLVDATACAYSGACSDGSGYLSDTPSSCSAAIGPRQSFASTSQVAAAMVGVWTSCAVGSTAGANEFIHALDVNAGAIEFTSDGHFFALGFSPNAQDPATERLTGPGDTGTLEVVDASATLGPGTYQARLTSSDGGVHVTQVILFGSPARLRLFSPGADDYVHAYTKKYQANICGPGFGPVYTPTGSSDLLSHLKGRWARCPNNLTQSVLSAFGGTGLEFPGDGTWYTLVEDETGMLVRTTDPLQHGTMQPAGSYSLTFTTAGPHSQFFQAEPLVDECGGLTFISDDVYPGTILNGGPVEGGSLNLSYDYRRLP